MEIIQRGIAGSVESNDVKIIIEPSDIPGIDIELQSVVIKQFGNQIRQVVEETILSKGIENAKVYVMDKGAIDFVIKSRTEAALSRACGKERWVWED